MQISRVNSVSIGLLNRAQNFKGLVGNSCTKNEYYSYHGEISSYNGTGHYEGYDDFHSDTYYPFCDETEEQIEKKIAEGNSCEYYNSDLTGGYTGSYTNSRDRGATLPFTTREWNQYSKNQAPRRIREYIEETLRRFDLAEHIKR